MRLERIPMELLIFLAEREGELVTRDEILDRIWGKDVFVDADNSINTAIRKIRAALKESPETPQFLHTVPGKGYRFIAGTAKGEGESADSVAPDSALPFRSERLKLVVLLSVGLALAALAALGISYTNRIGRGGDQHKVTLAVLPFANLSGDSKQEYFTDGMTAEVITQLGGLDPERLGVIARTSSMQYKNTHKGTALIAKELGAEYLLEGSVLREGGKIRVAAQLIQAKDQTQVWAGDFEGLENNVLNLQSELALAIAGKIAPTLPKLTRARLAESRPVAPEAYQAYLLGQQALESRTRDGALRSIAEFQRSIQLEPNYAPPYAGLATTYSLASVLGVMPTLEAMPKAKQAALRAIALDDSLAEGHTELAFVSAHYDFDWTAAEHEFRRAIELNPNDARAHFFYSNSFLSPMGRHEEAIAEIRKAMELDPFSGSIHSFMGTTLVWARKYEEALAESKECTEMFPGMAINHERLAHVYTYLGRYEEAIAEDTRAKILAGETPQNATRQAAELRRALASKGPKGYWKKLLEFSRLPVNPPEAYTLPQQLALIHTRLGQKEEALKLLEKAYSERGLSVTELGVEPAFDPLRSDPRYQNLLSLLGLRGMMK
ncbi:MAG: winged helix-turn-helix domain-containing protein [Acidobacteria bacterium]|nr:winged helix-turn-helix domain-containing protein [Acidobacteriota bacterium]MBS1866543.1 winged helix-turn-helix domain-containing protein [Acidobacteriota bacterium]